LQENYNESLSLLETYKNKYNNFKEKYNKLKVENNEISTDINNYMEKERK
jgi:hypothetical protein